MLDKDQRRGSIAFGARVAVGALVAGAVTLVLWFALRPTATLPLDGKLNVLVRPPDRTLEPVAVEQPGAVPVQSGGAMFMDVRLNQPAFAYLVWIDSEGQILPLYPWNNESLEIKDISQSPPERRPTNLVFSPMLGRNWTFGDVTGTETVLLLARRTPLPEGMQLGDLLQSRPPQLQRPTETIALGLTKSGKPDSESKAGGKKDIKLAAFLKPLGEHFELVRAVQFFHAEDGESGRGREGETAR
jgi:hypothetical protein